MTQIIDATGLILGRLASSVATSILKGQNVVIVNAEKAVISGKKEMVISRYKTKYKSGSKYGGPFWPKRPDLFVKRSVRGMIPWHKARGREAYKRLKVYMGLPGEFKEKAVTLESAMSKTENCICVETLCKELGWRA